MNTEQIEYYRKFYEENGYAIIPNVATDSEVAELHKRAEELVENFFEDENALKNASIFTTKDQQRKSDDYFLTSGDKVRFFFEEDAFDKNGKLICEKQRSINKIGHALYENDQLFRNFTNKENNIKIVKEIIGMKEPIIPQSMYIFKQPKVGGHVSIHQDNTFVNTKPLSCHALWFAIEDVTLENGCLWVVPKSHKEGIVNRFIRNKEGNGTLFRDADIEEHAPWSNLIEQFDDVKYKDKWIPLPISKGTVVLIHGNVVHKSDNNRSSNGRGAYTFHMVEKSAIWSPENWLQRSTPFPPLPLL